MRELEILINKVPNNKIFFINSFDKGEKYQIVLKKNMGIVELTTNQR